MIELELTFLATSLPADLAETPHKRIVDLYVENGTEHADLRIRQNGDQYEITRKTLIEDGDASKQNETTITLNQTEFENFSKTKAKKITKTRYYYETDRGTAEFDVFDDSLFGLVLVDFEFESEAEKEKFIMPEFCLADITQETFIAGGVLAGKTYQDIESEVARFGYKPLSL